MSTTTAHEPAVCIIFGGTGDLAGASCSQRSPRLHGGPAPRPYPGRGPWPSVKTDEAFRAEIRPWLLQTKIPAEHADRFLSRLHYQTWVGDKAEDIRALVGRLTASARPSIFRPTTRSTSSLPPGHMLTTVAALGACGLNNRKEGWTRVVLEKPFGTDLKTARELNDMVHQHFSETQIYRIDHYLGKETVQNLLVFRLANNLIESAWNRDRIERADHRRRDPGVGSRAGYYDKSGAMRDMEQNHIARSCRSPRWTCRCRSTPRRSATEDQVLRSIERPDLEEQTSSAGSTPPPSSRARTARAYYRKPTSRRPRRLRDLHRAPLPINSWRWKGVPFYIRTGKRMPKKFHDRVAFQGRAGQLRFQAKRAPRDSSDVLLDLFGPTEGFSFHFDIKGAGRSVPPGSGFPQVPGANDRCRDMRESYQTLLLDVLRGDQMLFVHADEVEQSKLFAYRSSSSPAGLSVRLRNLGPQGSGTTCHPGIELWQGDQ